MRIAVTAPESRLGHALLEGLPAADDGGHEVAALAIDPRDPQAAQAALAGVDVLVHLVPEAVQRLLAAPHAPAAPAAPVTAEGWRRDREALDYATRGTYVLLNAAVAAGVGRVVLSSTLDLLARYPAHWAVAETWRPRPDVTDVKQLAAFLAEQSARELARVEPLEVVCLRLGTVVDDAGSRGQRYDPRWLHVDDAVQAVGQALTARLSNRADHSSGRLGYGWWLYHVPGGGAYTRVPLAAAGREPAQGGLGYAPQHDFAGLHGAGEPPPAPAGPLGDQSVLEPRERVPSRPIRRVAVFGAGGPLAAAAAGPLSAVYQLRLTDLRPLDQIAAAGKPQSTGAPLPRVLGAPHETAEVDVTDFEQVRRACEGMDAVVNCTVVRPHPVQAFLVNTIGAYHVMRAAVAGGIRRVVHTGPLQVLNDRQGGYAWDFDIPDDVPARPGAWLYLHSKFLGQEIVRLFAEQFDLEVPVLLFCNFANPETARGQVNPMTISWADAGHALRRAVEVPSLPSAFERLHILAPLPHGKYSGERAYRVLSWTPRDDLAHLWARRGR